MWSSSSWCCRGAGSEEHTWALHAYSRSIGSAPSADCSDDNHISFVFFCKGYQCNETGSDSLVPSSDTIPKPSALFCLSNAFRSSTLRNHTQKQDIGQYIAYTLQSSISLSPDCPCVLLLLHHSTLPTVLMVLMDLLKNHSFTFHMKGL